MSTSLDVNQFATEWRQWHADRERDLAEPYGWLALVSLDWLDEHPRRYGDLPGLWWQDAEAAYVDPNGGQLSHEGQPITETKRVELVNSGAGTRVLAGDVEIE
ncbi:MAG TPA: hypothetical protein VGD84_04690, partial [Pseudonocardiaceae bacterium]